MVDNIHTMANPLEAYINHKSDQIQTVPSDRPDLLVDDSMIKLSKAIGWGALFGANAFLKLTKHVPDTYHDAVAANVAIYSVNALEIAANLTQSLVQYFRFKHYCAELELPLLPMNEVNQAYKLAESTTIDASLRIVGPATTS
jgi:hypothetical protein